MGTLFKGIGWIFIIFFGFIVLGGIFGNSEDEEVYGVGDDYYASDGYAMYWEEDEFHLGIPKTLVKNNIRGCGQFKYKQSEKTDSEYKVQCTRDGKNWVEYLVWTSSGSVSGPNKIK